MDKLDVHYTTLFEAMPGSCILLGNDAPHYTILAATAEYLKQSGTTKEGIIGKGIFEAFPGNPADVTDTGSYNLKASLEQVLEHKKPNHLPVQRYDVVGDDGDYSERYWRASNKPVLSPEGEIVYIIHSAEDITAEVKAAELEKHMKGLEESERELLNLVLHAPIGICVMDAATLVSKIANQSFVEIAGRPINEIVGWMYWDTFAEARPYYEEALNRVVKHGVKFSANEVEVPLIRHGKREIVHVTFIYEPLKDSNGVVKKVVVWVLDNTPQVIARRRVEESETKFRNMAENTPVLISVGDETSNATYFNQAWTDLTGKPMEELLNYGWLNLIHPDDMARYANIYQEYFVARASFTGEFRVLNATGEYNWVLAHAVPRYTTDGDFVGYIIACTDISEHKQVQQELKTALEQVRLSKEAAELGTFDLDLEKGTMHWDDRCRTLFGISHHNTVTYEKDFAGGLHPDDRERILKVIDKLFIRSISNGDYDVEYRTVGVEDGIIRWVRAKGKVYFNNEDKPVRFIGSVIDITEKVTAIQKIEKLVEERTIELAQANETLKNINKELQRSNQNLEEFAHAASHDLKEPVRKIDYFTNHLKSQLSPYLKEGELRSFNRIENATHRMGNLIDDLLLYSHVSQRPHETEHVDLNHNVQNVLEDLELNIEEKKAVIEVEDLPIVKGYRRQLQQLFQNLLSNALKYSKEDVAPHIHITADKVKENGKEYHLIAMKDNGIGFESEYYDKIFQMFTRLHGKSEYSGTGVGLSIVKKVVENHDGFIGVESTVGEGSVFKVYLPVKG